MASNRNESRSRKSRRRTTEHSLASVSEPTESPGNPVANKSGSNGLGNRPTAKVLPDASAPPSGHATDPQRYRSVGELGRGGWGVVERAVDRQLGREVAVKRITGAAHMSEDARQRFLHEAKITSQLQHPGIVPVHELSDGHSHGARPRETFYVMKLLEGDTLRNEIRKTHAGLRQRGKLPSSVDYHAAILPLLNRFIDICNAVGYAHSRGILHRDLKPANVMIGRFGETIVVDWGLAKQLERNPLASGIEGDRDAEIAADRVDAADGVDGVDRVDGVGTGPGTSTEASSEPMTESQSQIRDYAAIEHDLDVASRWSEIGNLDDHSPRRSGVPTSHGTVIGTPAYMSPEQARGEVEDLRPTSDLYSLGVILYEILVGQHPFAGLGIDEVLDKVKRSHFQSAKQAEPLVPRPLSAICHHAMRPVAENRYSSADAIAIDIQNFITGDPVSVDQETMTDRAVRSVRRHQTMATTLTAVGMMGLIAAIAIAGLIQRSHKIERQAHAQTQYAQAEAMTRLTQTREAADAWFIDLSGALQFDPGLQPIRQKLLDDAIAQYQSLLAATQRDDELNIPNDYQSDDPLRQMQQRLIHQRILERIQCDCRLGDLYRLTHRNAEAVSHYRTVARDAKALLRVHRELNVGDTDFRQHVQIEWFNARIGQLLVLPSGEGIREGSASQTSDDVSELVDWLDQHADRSPRGLWIKHASCVSRLLFAWSRAVGMADSSVVEHLRVADHWARELFVTRGSDADARWVETVKIQLADALIDRGDDGAAEVVLGSLVSHLNRLVVDQPSRVDFRRSLENAQSRLEQLPH